MKKWNLMLAVSAFICVSTIIMADVISSSTQQPERKLIMANIEALTSEGDAERVIIYCVYNMKSEPKYGERHEVIYCGDCLPHSATTEWGEGLCSREK